MASALSAANMASLTSFGEVNITYYYTCGFKPRRYASSKSYTDMTMSTSIINVRNVSLYLATDVV